MCDGEVIVKYNPVVETARRIAMRGYISNSFHAYIRDALKSQTQHALVDDKHSCKNEYKCTSQEQQKKDVVDQFRLQHTGESAKYQPNSITSDIHPTLLPIHMSHHLPHWMTHLPTPSGEENTTLSRRGRRYNDPVALPPCSTCGGTISHRAKLWPLEHNNGPTGNLP